MGFRRARSEDQIEMRIQEICQAALQIFSEKGYDGLNFSAISELTQFTRPTIYKYFANKDEILLYILTGLIQKKFTDMSCIFEQLTEVDIEAITDIWVDGLVADTTMLELFPLLFTTIEKNVSIKALTEAKRSLLLHQEKMAMAFGRLFPEASSETLLFTLGSLLSSALGLFPMTHITEKQRQAMIAARGAEYEMDFVSHYKNIVYQSLYCLQHHISLEKS